MQYSTGWIYAVQHRLDTCSTAQVGYMQYSTGWIYAVQHRLDTCSTAQVGYISVHFIRQVSLIRINWTGLINQD